MPAAGIATTFRFPCTTIVKDELVQEVDPSSVSSNTNASEVCGQESKKLSSLRTALSVLGVVLGVAAVIAMMSVSEGAAREALAQVDALGLDNIVAQSSGGLNARGTLKRSLIAADAARALDLVPSATLAAPVEVICASP